MKSSIKKIFGEKQINRIRIAVLTIGWLWFCTGITFIAATSIYPTFATLFILHGGVDLLAGLLHFWIYGWLGDDE